MLPGLDGVASLATGALNYFGAREANRANKKMAREQMSFQQESNREQMQFQERMSNTAYQRAVQDMTAAGLNPMLAYGMGGASSPGGASSSGASSQMQNEVAPAVSSAIDVRRSIQELRNMRAQEDSIKKQAYQADQAGDLSAVKSYGEAIDNARKEWELKMDKTDVGTAARWLDKFRHLKDFNLKGIFKK